VRQPARRVLFVSYLLLMLWSYFPGPGVGPGGGGWGLIKQYCLLFPICFGTVIQALALAQEGKVEEIVDPALHGDFNPLELRTLVHVALMCTSRKPEQRPYMSQGESRGRV